MSVRLRFQRVGMPKQPYYRLVAVDKRHTRDSAEIEILGHYNPKEKNNTLTINSDRVKYWLSCGAQPSDTVKTLLNRTDLNSKVSAEKPEKT